MQTQIYTTKKLEKFVKKLVKKEGERNSSILGDWNASVFYIDRKKCLIFTNKKTKYNVILPDVKAADLINLDELFKNTFYSQLVYDGIRSSFDYIASLTGKLVFRPTDNDRSTTGFQNQRLSNFDYWKVQYGSLENMPMKELTGRINNYPIHIGESKKMEESTYSSIAMKQLILIDSMVNN